MALFIGIIFIFFAVYAVLPGIPRGLQWGPEVLVFLKGGVPVVVLFIGLIAVLIGIADIKDKAEAKKEVKKEAPEAESRKE